MKPRYRRAAITMITPESQIFDRVFCVYRGCEYIAITARPPRGFFTASFLIEFGFGTPYKFSLQLYLSRFRCIRSRKTRPRVPIACSNKEDASWSAVYMRRTYPSA